MFPKPTPGETLEAHRRFFEEELTVKPEHKENFRNYILGGLLAEVDRESFDRILEAWQRYKARLAKQENP